MLFPLALCSALGANIALARGVLVLTYALWVQDWTRVSRRSPGRPGSYPPRCIGKCGRCNPCRAVHVTVPPVIAEYYPEAWRCKCGGRLYIP